MRDNSWIFDIFILGFFSTRNNKWEINMTQLPQLLWKSSPRQFIAYLLELHTSIITNWQTSPPKLNYFVRYRSDAAVPLCKVNHHTCLYQPKYQPTIIYIYIYIYIIQKIHNRVLLLQVFHFAWIFVNNNNSCSISTKTLWGCIECDVKICSMLQEIFLIFLVVSVWEFLK